MERAPRAQRDWLLVTDIDGTLIGESETTLQLRSEVLGARRELATRGARLRWVVATGRDLASATEALLENGLSLGDFDAFITSVGAELYFSGEQRPDPHYHARLRASGFDPREVRAVLDPLPGLVPQPEHEQYEHKVCYLMFASDGVGEAQPAGQRERRAVLDALELLPFATTTVFAMDAYLDVAPENGAKGGAIAHLLEHWELDPARVVAAGDSGNDLSMLERPWPGIVVANGQRELSMLRGEPSVYFAERKYAAGVLEGLRALGFL